MKKIVSKIIYLIFGEWNGVQNFVAPTIMIFLFDQYTFVNWMTGVLTIQKYFIPLFVYIVVLFSTIFLCIKVLIQWKHNPIKCKASVDIYRDFLIPFIYKLHKWLLLFFTLIIAVYLLKSGFAFFYKIRLPLFSVYYWLLRIGSVILTMYIFTFLQVAIPLIKRGMKLNKAQDFFHSLIIKRWKSAVPIIIVQLLWIYVSILLYTLAIDQLHYSNELGYFKTNGEPMEFLFQNVQNLNQFILNIVTLLGAFLISNFLYSPIMLLTNKGFKHFKLTLKNI